jgi:hypothetical protein
MNPGDRVEFHWEHVRWFGYIVGVIRANSFLDTETLDFLYGPSHQLYGKRKRGILFDQDLAIVKRDSGGKVICPSRAFEKNLRVVPIEEYAATPKRKTVGHSTIDKPLCDVNPFQDTESSFDNEFLRKLGIAVFDEPQ